jgi:hypothetical protein
MTDMLTGMMMEELAKIITCVTGDARERRTIYEADQDFERFGKTLIANFKDKATLWAFLRASLRQCHIHKLSKVGKDKATWAKADEYLTNLKDSDTILTLEDTNNAIKRAENYMQRQDTDGDKRVDFSRLMGALLLTRRKPRGRSGLHSTPGLAGTVLTRRLAPSVVRGLARTVPGAVPRRCKPGFHRSPPRGRSHR